MKGLSHTYTCIHSSPNSPPIQADIEHWAELPVLHSRTLLVICFNYSSVARAFLVTHLSIFTGELYLFIRLWVTVKNPALQPEGLRAEAELSQLLQTGHVLISPSFSKHSFATHRILGWQLLFLQHFKYTDPCHLASEAPNEKSVHDPPRKSLSFADIMCLMSVTCNRTVSDSIVKFT